MDKAIIQFLADNLYYLLIGVLVLNLVQRRYQKHAPKKRMATLLLGVLVLVLMIASILILQFSLPSWVLFLVAAVLVSIAYKFRKKMIPFALRCRGCGKNLSFNRVVFFDSNRCELCDPEHSDADH